MFYFNKYLKILKTSKEIIDLQRQNGQEQTVSFEASKNIYKIAFNELVNQGLPNRISGDYAYIETDGLVYDILKSELSGRQTLSIIYNENTIIKPPIDEDYIKNDDTRYNNTDNEEDEEEYEEINDEIDDYNEDQEEDQEESMSILKGDIEDIQIEEDSEDIEDIDNNEDNIENTNENGFKETDNGFVLGGNDSYNDNSANEGSEYNYDEIEEPTDMFEENDYSINEPDFEEEYIEGMDIEPDVIEEKEPEELIPVANKNENITNKEPEQEEDKSITSIGYLEKSEFIMSHIILNYNRDGKSEKIEIIASPIYPHKEISPQIACVVMEGRAKTTASTDEETDIKIVLDADTNLLIKNKYSEEQYDPEIVLDENYDDRNIKIISKKNVGNVGHLQDRDDDNNIEVHIFPISFNNSKKTGKANCMYYIDVDGDLTIGDTLHNPEIAFEFDGKITNITSLWNEDGKLYMKIS